jgi:hypothetical protein
MGFDPCNGPLKIQESIWDSNSKNGSSLGSVTLLEILSFATSHYATSMQLVVVCNYFGHVYNYKFSIV